MVVSKGSRKAGQSFISEPGNGSQNENRFGLFNSEPYQNVIMHKHLFPPELAAETSLIMASLWK